MTDPDLITCEDALRLLAEYIDGELEEATRRDVHRHMETCRACYSRAEFERRLKARLTTLGTAAVRPELEQRVRTLIGQYAVSPASAPRDATDE
jgi:anti-sigma factor (TIGR02949 family)